MIFDIVITHNGDEPLKEVSQDGEPTLISVKRESSTLLYLRRKNEGFCVIHNDNFAFSLQKRENYVILLVSGVRFRQMRRDFGQQ